MTQQAPPAGGVGLLQRLPLRVTLIVALVLLATVGLTTTGAVVTAQLRGYLVDQVDQDLTRLVDSDGDRDLRGRLDDQAPLQSSRDEYYAFATLDGSIASVNEHTSNGADPPELSPAEVRRGANQQAFTTSHRGGAWRILVRPQLARSQSGDPVPALYVRGISLSDVEDTTDRLVLAELLVGLAVLAVLGGLAYVVVGTSLKPLREVETTAAAIAAGDLSRRVPESSSRTEVGRLARALNGMLAQIETAFRARERSETAARASEDRMRQFVADASHELRTPLTSIRGFAELYRQGAVNGADEVQRVMRRVEDEASRMGLLVEDLLLLARLDQQRPLQRKPVDLLEIVTDAVGDARVLAPGRDVDLAVHGEEAPVVLGDEPRLRQVVTNLMSNALTHTPVGTAVAVTLDTGAKGVPPGHVRVAVHDRGPGLTPEDRSKVFERFYRSDPSRTRSAGGTGLGLSIVAALVAAHGGSVTVESEPGRGSTFAVDLPLLAQPAAD